MKLLLLLLLITILSQTNSEPEFSTFASALLCHSRVKYEKWTLTSEERGNSNFWSDLPTPMQLTLGENDLLWNQTTLVIQVQIFNNFHTLSDTNTEYRIVVDDEPISLTNTGDHAYTSQPLVFHGVTTVSWRTTHVVKVQYRTDDGEEVWRVGTPLVTPDNPDRFLIGTENSFH